MHNRQDVQYLAEVMIGGQPIQALLDTGSFDMVVFSKSCTGCGAAGAYQHSSFQPGGHSEVRNYISGSCDVEDGRAPVALAAFRTELQDLWLATRCSFPTLGSLPWEAVVGLGPPGKAEYVATQELHKVRALMSRFREEHKEVPNDLLTRESLWQQKLDDALQKTALLESLGVTTFSACFEQHPGSPAWLIWNDAKPQGSVRIPVAGNITWSIAVKGMGLGTNGVISAPLGCEDGCAAVLDTGTSFIGVPDSMYAAFQAALGSHLRWGCDLRELPDLILEVEGGVLRLPPDSYVGARYGQVSADVEEFMREEDVFDSNGHAGCQLLLFNLKGRRTKLGPLVILGMPFFRSHYTTFDLGANRNDRSIFLSHASNDCRPSQEDGKVLRRTPDVSKPRQIDISRAQAPHWLHNLTGDGI